MGDLRALCLGALAVVGGLLAAGAPPAAHAAAAPPGMFGLGGWQWPSTAALDRESSQGLRTWRVALDYGAVAATPGTLEFSGVDDLVGRAAQRGITPLFVLTGCPAWQCPDGGPANSDAALPGWLDFVRAAVQRYGTGGTFWAAHPSVPARPVTAWQVGNEVNGADQWPNPSPAAYASFLQATSQAIRGADAAAQVVLAGLPEKMTIWMRDYLPALYAQPGFRSSFDVVAINAYAPGPADVPAILDTARSIMVDNGDAAKPLWITEMAWATAGPAHPFVTTEDGQAANLRDSWDALLACAPRWNLQRVYWYGYQDAAVPAGAGDYWGYHVGLVRPDGTPKPALSDAEDYLAGAPLPGDRGGTCALAGGTDPGSVPAAPAPTGGTVAGAAIRTPPTTTPVWLAAPTGPAAASIGRRQAPRTRRRHARRPLRTCRPRAQRCRIVELPRLRHGRQRA